MQNAPRERPRPPTYADIEALPPNVVGEIINGELVVSPRPTPKHAKVCGAVTTLLTRPFQFGLDGPGGWWILPEPELSLGVDSKFDPIVPDVAGWRVTRMETVPEEAQVTVVPDWVCEVLSPRTARHDRIQKLPFYARAGVGHAWLVDPSLETIEVFRLEQGRWSLIQTLDTAETVAVAPFDAVPLEIGLLWGLPAGTEQVTEPGSG